MSYLEIWFEAEEAPEELLDVLHSDPVRTTPPGTWLKTPRPEVVLYSTGDLEDEDELVEALSGITYQMVHTPGDPPKQN